MTLAQRTGRIFRKDFTLSKYSYFDNIFLMASVSFLPRVYEISKLGNTRVEGTSYFMISIKKNVGKAMSFWPFVTLHQKCTV